MPQLTVKCKVFRDCLEDIEFENTEYWYNPQDELDIIITKMWFQKCSTMTNEMGKQNPYIVTSMRNTRHALNCEYKFIFMEG